MQRLVGSLLLSGSHRRRPGRPRGRGVGGVVAAGPGALAGAAARRRSPSAACSGSRFTPASASGWRPRRTALRLRHGLLEHRTQTVPPGRVQAVRLVQPLLWRGAGWWRVRVNVAGYGGRGDDQRDGETSCCPVGTRAEAHRGCSPSWSARPRRGAGEDPRARRRRGAGRQRRRPTASSPSPPPPAGSTRSPGGATATGSPTRCCWSGAGGCTASWTSSRTPARRASACGRAPLQRALGRRLVRTALHPGPGRAGRPAPARRTTRPGCCRAVSAARARPRPASWPAPGALAGVAARRSQPALAAACDRRCSSQPNPPRPVRVEQLGRLAGSCGRGRRPVAHGPPVFGSTRRRSACADGAGPRRPASATASSATCAVTSQEPSGTGGTRRPPR